VLDTIKYLANPNSKPQQCFTVRVRGGAEAIFHEGRTFVASASPSHALVKLDFNNAINTVRRDWIFESVATHLPSSLPYIIFSYESPSSLLHGSYTLHSSGGVQQENHWGPNFLASAFQKLSLNLIVLSCWISVWNTFRWYSSIIRASFVRKDNNCASSESSLLNSELKLKIKFWIRILYNSNYIILSYWISVSVTEI